MLFMFFFWTDERKYREIDFIWKLSREYVEVVKRRQKKRQLQMSHLLNNVISQQQLDTNVIFK